MGTVVDLFVERFINRMQMVSFGAFVNQSIVAFVTLFFTVQSGRLLAAADPMYHTYGIQLATLVVGTVVAKLVTNTWAAGTVRKTSREHMAGQARIEEAKAAGTNINVTSERTAMHVDAPAVAPGGGNADIRHGE